MDLQERLDYLQEAESHLEQAINAIREALIDTVHDRHAEAYIIGHLQDWISSPRGMNMGVAEYAEALQNPEEDEDPEEDYNTEAEWNV